MTAIHRYKATVSLGAFPGNKPQQLQKPAICRAAAQGSWFHTSKDIVCPKLQPAQFKGVRGMQVLEDILPGESFAQVSVDAALLVQPLKKCPFPEYCSPEQWRASPWYVQMALLLLYERDVRGQESRVKHYVSDLMAIDIDTPVEWSEEQVGELQYGHLQRLIQQQKAGWQGHYEAVKGASEGRILREGFMWAMQAVRSRAFSGPWAGARLRTRAILAAVLVAAGSYLLLVVHTPIEKVLNAGIAAVLFNILYDVLLSRKLKWYAMIPVIDYCNHSPSVQSDVSFEVYRERFSLSCSTAFKKGEQAFISYGKHNNDYLMQYYGFSIPKLPHDTYTLASGEGGEAGIPKEIVFSWRGPVGETAAWLKEKEAADRKAAYKVLVDLCEGEKKAWPTSLKSDAKLAKSTEDARLKTAVLFRMEKKEILESCLRHCRGKAGMKAAVASS